VHYYTFSLVGHAPGATTGRGEPRAVVWFCFSVSGGWWPPRAAPRARCPRERDMALRARAIWLTPPHTRTRTHTLLDRSTTLPARRASDAARWALAGVHGCRWPVAGRRVHSAAVLLSRRCRRPGKCQRRRRTLPAGEGRRYCPCPARRAALAFSRGRSVNGLNARGERNLRGGASHDRRKGNDDRDGFPDPTARVARNAPHASSVRVECDTARAANKSESSRAPLRAAAAAARGTLLATLRAPRQPSVPGTPAFLPVPRRDVADCFASLRSARRRKGPPARASRPSVVASDSTHDSPYNGLLLRGPGKEKSLA
jgi:hypothetical protein